MKALVFLLVLGNLLFYAFSAGYFGTPENPDAGRIAQQIRPENIRLVSRDGGAPAAAPEPVAEAPASTPASSDETLFCLALTQLGAVEANRLSDLLRDSFDDVRLSRQGEGNGWWVYIPPLADKAAADKKAAELRGLGVDDYFVIPDGPNRRAISLGVFSSEKGAQERLNALRSRGIRSARTGLRPEKDGMVSVEMQGPEARRADFEAALTRAFPGRTTQACR